MSTCQVKSVTSLTPGMSWTVVDCIQDELLVVKDKIVLEIVDLVKWVADDDEDALNQLLASRAATQVDRDGS